MRRTLRGDGKPLSPEPRRTAMVVLQDRFRTSQQRPVPLADVEKHKLKQMNSAGSAWPFGLGAAVRLLMRSTQSRSYSSCIHRRLTYG